MTVDRDAALASLIEWLEAVGPEFEDDFWDALHSDAEARIELLRKLTRHIEEPE